MQQLEALSSEPATIDNRTRIGEYEIKRLVGEGGMGRVYEAEERLSKRRVAVKVLRPELMKHEEGRRLFMNEMQILAHLEHPNLVRSLASMEHEGQLVMVLEFLEGRTLRGEVDEGKISWTRAVDIAAQIAGALSVAHAQDPAIVHRDLKPENVMVLPDGTVKVMDFGIAKVLEQANATNTRSIGTLQYMSPEQIDAQTIDARSDLYTLGLLMYEMVAGEPPFRSASPRELLNMQCTAEPPPLDVELPAGVEDLIFALLAKSPDGRPATAEDVLAILEPFRVKTDKKRTRTTRTSSPDTVPEISRNPSSSGARKAVPRSGDTLVSTPSPRKATDTIALIERATMGREIGRTMAIGIIIAASLLAGAGTYALRSKMHAQQPSADPPAVTQRDTSP